MQKTIADVIRALPQSMGSIALWADAPQIILSKNIQNTGDSVDFNCFSDTVSVLGSIGELDSEFLSNLGLPFKQARVAIMSQAVDVESVSSSHVFYSDLLFKIINYDQVQGKVTLDVIRSRNGLANRLEIYV